MKEQQPGSWVAFRNREKGENTRRPDFVGRAAPVCQHCGSPSNLKIAVWRNQSQKAEVGEFLSGTFQEWREKTDDVPF